MPRIVWCSLDPPEPLGASEWNIQPASSLEAAIDAVRANREGAGAVVLEPHPSYAMEEAAEDLLRTDRTLPVIARIPAGDFALGVRLAQLGVNEVLPLDGRVEELAAAIAKWIRRRQPAGSEPWRRFLVGQSQEMRKVAELIQLVGPRRATVLITGESGTGKEVVARAIHSASTRAAKPIVAVNCTALPENLLEAELFGHTKGAFTGAVQARAGRFEQANGGTLFLDEIGDMPLDLQAKLLRVLQEREFERLGSSETVRVDVRLIAATNADLPEKVRAGRFREDLYYRLNVVPLPLPPLRERPADIPMLAEHFLEKIRRQEEMAPRRIAPEAMDRLKRYSWPGNVRQLENAIEHALALSGDRTLLLPHDFPLPAPVRTRPAEPPAAATPAVAIPEDGCDFEHLVGSFELQLLEQALRKANGNKTQAADMLKLKRTTLTAKLKSLEASAGRSGL